MKINVLVQLGMKKHPDMGNAPLVMDYAKTDSDRGVLELIFARQDMAYPIVAPPGVPQARVAELRRAFEAVLRDPDYLADAKKQQLETDGMRGEDIAKLIDRIYATPPAVIARARAALSPRSCATAISARPYSTWLPSLWTTKSSQQCSLSTRIWCDSHQTAG